jgi:hypothetical protein
MVSYSKTILLHIFILSIIAIGLFDPVDLPGKDRRRIVSNKSNTIGTIKTVEDLGSFTRMEIDDLLLRASMNFPDPNKRLLYILRHLIGTPFQYEEKGKIKPDRNQMLVKLSAFDCITLIYYLSALNFSESYDAFVLNLARIRYKNPIKLGIHTDHDRGNLFDYGYNALIINGVETLGFFYNFSDELISHYDLKPYNEERVLKRVKVETSVGTHFARPKYAPDGIRQKVSMNFIYPDDIDIIKKNLRSGDIVLFGKRLRTKKELAKGQTEVLIGHCGVIVKGKDLPGDMFTQVQVKLDRSEVYFIHASRYNNRNGKKTGVDYAGYYHKKIPKGYTQYDSRIPRTLKNYVKGIGFAGIAVLRPVD